MRGKNNTSGFDQEETNQYSSVQLKLLFFRFKGLQGLVQTGAIGLIALPLQLRHGNIHYLAILIWQAN